MKVVALISGGKDSCFNMMKCIENDHSIVALANLYPPNNIMELDSYMYQSVGCNMIPLIAEAMGKVPLYQKQILGKPISIEDAYIGAIIGDEVEDLFELLKEVKEKEGIEGVSVGAIHSNYQKVRVENICQRLGLEMLAYLWKLDQGDLLLEMIEKDVKAILIKVAALGLNFSHLGKYLEDIRPHLLLMEDKYGLNVCGEGGEFETLVLDCPLYKQSIQILESEIITHSKDDIAPVGFLNIKSAILVHKL